MNFNLTHRPRRIRNNPVLRSLVKEQELSHNDLVLPVFVSEQAQVPEKIDSMPEIFRWPLNLLVSKIKEWQDIGINTFAIFPQIQASKKNPLGSEISIPIPWYTRLLTKLRQRLIMLPLLVILLSILTQHTGTTAYSIVMEWLKMIELSKF